ncbi:hypothetical protein Tco_0417429 [Tanacetum coccineum]
MGTKAGDKKQEEIVVVRDFPDQYKVTAIVWNLLIANLSGQLKELQQRFHSDKLTSPVGAPIFFVKKKDGSFQMVRLIIEIYQVDRIAEGFEDENDKQRSDELCKAIKGQSGFAPAPENSRMEMERDSYGFCD